MSDSTVPTSDTTNAPENAPQTPEKATAKRKRANTKKTAFDVRDLARARLRARGIKSDERLTDECKVVRGILRANFTFVQKNDASVRKAKDTANDRKPWPTAMNSHTFDVAVNGKRPKQSK